MRKKEYFLILIFFFLRRINVLLHSTRVLEILEKRFCSCKKQTGRNKTHFSFLHSFPSSSFRSFPSFGSFHDTKSCGESHDLARSRKEEEKRRERIKLDPKQMRHWTASVRIKERKKKKKEKTLHCTWLFSSELKTHCEEQFFTAEAYPLFIMRPVTT